MVVVSLVVARAAVLRPIQKKKWHNSKQYSIRSHLSQSNNSQTNDFLATSWQLLFYKYIATAMNNFVGR